MSEKILGLHHITAIAGDARRNLNFYTKVLGLRLIKKTVNFDDPKTYHFYFGDGSGSPGTILTFFPWGEIVTGRRGTHMATEIGFSVPEGSFDFWIKHLGQYNVTYNKPAEKFGERYLTFLDPDGLKLELIESSKPDTRQPWLSEEVGGEAAIRGFHNVTLTLREVKATAELLTDVLGYKQLDKHVNRYRFSTDAVENAAIVDLVEVPHESRGHQAGGTIHHVAFRVKNEQVLLQYRNQIAARGLEVTDLIDRNYFYSIYFREPGGVLFEIATENPGFTADEPLDLLGTSLKLPDRYEHRREELEQVLPKLD